jgi:hypothetical protein
LASSIPNHYEKLLLKTKETKMIYQNILIHSKVTDKVPADICHYFQKISGIHPLIFEKIIKVMEGIDEKGNVFEPLVESELNIILRSVFEFRKANIFIALKNSQFNSLHEKILVNLLWSAGYKSVFPSYLFG